MINKTKYLLVLLLIFVSLPSNAWDLFDDDNPLPVKGTVRTRVDFWKKIYTEVTTTQGLIHDIDDLSIVYKKIDIPMARRVRKRILKKEKGKVRALLRSIAKKDGDDLTDEEKEIYKIVKGKSSKEINKLAKNLRCQYGLKDRYYEGLIRSYAYIDYIRATFKKYGVPSRLAYLPHVESSFNYHAYSKVGAAGIWQFMRSTGRQYGLKLNYIVDERRDPIKATIAAAKLLRDNYRVLKKWPLALTAYNHGARSIKRAIKEVGSDEIHNIIDNYKGRRFGFASKNFYSTFMATVEISENPGKYFPAFKDPGAFKYSTIKLDRKYRMEHIKKIIKFNIKTMRAYNPHIRKMAYGSHLFLPKKLEVRIPQVDEKTLKEYKLALSNIKISKKAMKLATLYKVRRGDSLFSIARTFRVNINDIITFNQISNPKRIYPGLRLKIPGTGDVKKMASLVPARKTKRRKAVAVIIEPKKKEIISDGVILGTDYPVVSYVNEDVETPEELIKDVYSLFEMDDEEVENIMAHGEDLFLLPERSKISLRSYDLELEEVTKDIYRIKIETDETLGHYSDWALLPMAKLRSLNKIGRKSGIQMGQSLVLKISESRLADFQRKRSEYHFSIQEDFFSSYKVTGKKPYTVKRGDTIDRILRRNELPIWLLRDQQDKKMNLAHRLVVGQKIFLPEVVQIGEDFSLMPTDKDE